MDFFSKLVNKGEKIYVYNKATTLNSKKNTADNE